MTSLALKRVMRVVAGQSPPSDEVSAFDGSGLPFLQGNAEFGQSHPLPRHRCESAPKRAQAGDILLSVRAPVGALNIADRDYGIGRGLASIRPVGLDSRFAWWSLHAGIDQLRAMATGSTFEAITAEDIGSLVVQLPSPSGQRAVADFLDAETARIDALIERKRRMESLVTERLAFQIEAEVRAIASERGEIALRHVAEVTVGIVVTPARYYADHGVPALRGLNVLPGSLRLDDVVRITPEGHALHPKSRLRAGDLVTVRTGQAGATAVVPRELDGANCIDLLVTRAREGLSPDFLELVINSDWCKKHIEQHSVGAIQGHFNVEALKGLPVPRAEFARQADFVERIRGARQQVQRLVSVLGAQIELLREHRQALITAAVTGELDPAKAAA